MHAGSELSGGLGASLGDSCDLKFEPIQILLIGSLKELTCILSKFMIFKNSDPRKVCSLWTWLKRNGKFKVR